jgi:hypothetical protein
MSLLDLPLEIFRHIIHRTVRELGIQKAVALRLVNSETGIL